MRKVFSGITETFDCTTLCTEGSGVASCTGSSMHIAELMTTSGGGGGAVGGAGSGHGIALGAAAPHAHPHHHHITAAAGAGCSSSLVGSSAGCGGSASANTEPCRFPKLEECAHFHYERVQLPHITVSLHTALDQTSSLQHSQHNSIISAASTECSSSSADDAVVLRNVAGLSSADDCGSSSSANAASCVTGGEWFTVQVQSGDECWLLQRNVENFRMLDAQLHQCCYDRHVSQLCDLTAMRLRVVEGDDEATQDACGDVLSEYLQQLCTIADNTINCAPVLNWLQMDNRGHRLLVPSEESRNINTPAVAAAYSVRRYVSQARDELSLEVGDMISVIDMASPGESVWWRGKRGFQVGFFPQQCVHIIGDKVPRNMPLPPPVVGSVVVSPIKPVLRKHGKLIAFFRSFILSRPSRRRLKQSGILRERVFSCDLGEHLLNSGNDIPTVLRCCAEFIESNGIVDGIYRLSGVTSNIQKLRNAFDEDRIPNLYSEDILQDIHSVASLLKMYFRELPNPLCTYQLYTSFVAAVQHAHQHHNAASGSDNQAAVADHNQHRLAAMRDTVQKLPPPHYRTLAYLMRHLARVARHGARTGMTTRNIAIVWAPNLLRCVELEVGGVAALQGVGVQAVVTEFLICYADLIFTERGPNGGGAVMALSAQHEGIDDAIDDCNKARMSTVSAAMSSYCSPKRCRPKSLAIATPTKLITLEEARSKHGRHASAVSAVATGASSTSGGYIEVGGGPDSLPKIYHTVIDLPAGHGHPHRKRSTTNSGNSGQKRGPLTTWRSFFGGSGRSSTRASSSGAVNKCTRNESAKSAISNPILCKSRKNSTPNVSLPAEIALQDPDGLAGLLGSSDTRRTLRSVKSAESLTSGGAGGGNASNGNLPSEANSCSELDMLGPLGGGGKLSSHHSKTGPGHNRSVSHDSYFDMQQAGITGASSSHGNSEASLLDISEIQINFELEESEMRIFSEDESLVSSPRIVPQQQQASNKVGAVRTAPASQQYYNRAVFGGIDDATTTAGLYNNVLLSGSDTSPKKQAAAARLTAAGFGCKRSKLEDQLQFIDSCTNSRCSTPSPTGGGMFHDVSSGGGGQVVVASAMIHCDNSERMANARTPQTPSYVPLLTESGSSPSEDDDENHGGGYHRRQESAHAQVHHRRQSGGELASPSSPLYSMNYSNIAYQNLHNNGGSARSSSTAASPKNSPVYENVLTTISITYKSPTKSFAPTAITTATTPAATASSSSQRLSGSANIYEDVETESPAMVPTSVAALPVQQANENFARTRRPDTLCTSSDEQLPGNAMSMTTSGTSSILLPPDATDGGAASLTPGSDRPLLMSSSAATDDFTASMSEVIAALTTSAASDSSAFRITPDEPEPPPPSEAALSPFQHHQHMRSFDELSMSSSTGGGGSVQLFPMTRSVNLIEFSPSAEENNVLQNGSGGDKRKSCERDEDDEDYGDMMTTMAASTASPSNNDTDELIYQQVKYLRRSVHEINSLVATNHDDGEDEDDTYENVRFGHQTQTVPMTHDVIAAATTVPIGGCDNPSLDSLEPEINPVFDMCAVYENVDFCSDSLESSTTARQSIASDSAAPAVPTPIATATTKTCVYERDAAPPCVRARNLKLQLGGGAGGSNKTRSLDGDDFKHALVNDIENKAGHQVGRARLGAVSDMVAALTASLGRRKSFDDGFKMHSLPKSLNQPKHLPQIDSATADAHHIKHLADGNASATLASPNTIDNVIGTAPPPTPPLSICVPDSVHVAHAHNYDDDTTPSCSNESSTTNGATTSASAVAAPLNRARIDRYKEERRKALHAKFQPMDSVRSATIIVAAPTTSTSASATVSLPRPCSEPAAFVNSNDAEAVIDDDSAHPSVRDAVRQLEPAPPPMLKNATGSAGGAGGSIRLRTAMFETSSAATAVAATAAPLSAATGNDLQLRSWRTNAPHSAPGADEDGNSRFNHRRHTVEPPVVAAVSTAAPPVPPVRDLIAARRASLETRTIKEKMSPSYNIKDMKAIFESKAHQ